MNCFLRMTLSAFSLCISAHSSYAMWDAIELKDATLVRKINSKKKFSEQDTFNLYFSSQTSLYWGETEIEENDREYFLNLAEQLTPSNHSINHLFAKIFSIYEDKKGRKHYIESVVLAKFHGFKNTPGVSHFIGLSVTKKAINGNFKTKRYIDFSSGTSKKTIKRTSVSDRDALILIHSGQKTKFSGHSEDRFFKLESSSNAVNNKKKYNKSIFEQLITKKAIKIKKIVCFGVKFFSRYDVCGKCQNLIIDQLRKDKGLRQEFIKSRKALGLKDLVNKNVPFIPIYYSGRPYTDIVYSFYKDEKIYKHLKVENVKRTSSIYFKRKDTDKIVYPQQSFETEPNQIDLSLDYLQGCIISNIRTLYTE